jgi:hypothetical protein
MLAPPSGLLSVAWYWTPPPAWPVILIGPLRRTPPSSVAEASQLTVSPSGGGTCWSPQLTVPSILSPSSRSKAEAPASTGSVGVRGPSRRGR